MGFVFIAIAFFSGLCGVLCHLAVARSMRGRVVIRSLLICGCFTLIINFAAVFAVCLSSSFRLPALDFAGVILANQLIGVCGWYGYYTFINLNMTSVRIRIFKEIVKAGGVLDIGALEREYSPKGMLKERLQRLLNMGQLKLVDDGYRIERVFLLRVAIVIELAKYLVLGHGFRVLNSQVVSEAQAEVMGERVLKK